MLQIREYIYTQPIIEQRTSIVTRQLKASNVWPVVILTGYSPPSDKKKVPWYSPTSSWLCEPIRRDPVVEWGGNRTSVLLSFAKEGVSGLITTAPLLLLGAGDSSWSFPFPLTHFRVFKLIPVYWDSLERWQWWTTYVVMNEIPNTSCKCQFGSYTRTTAYHSLLQRTK